MKKILFWAFILILLSGGARVAREKPAAPQPPEPTAITTPDDLARAKVAPKFATQPPKTDDRLPR